MVKQRFSSTPRDTRMRSPEKMTSVRGTNRIPKGNERKTRPRHSIRDIFTAVAGFGVLKILRSTLPKLDLAPATGKPTATAGIEKTASASGGAKAARVSWIDVLKQLYVRFSKDRVMAVAAGVTFYAFGR
jgi:hypothetical protein